MSLISGYFLTGIIISLIPLVINGLLQLLSYRRGLRDIQEYVADYRFVLVWLLGYYVAGLLLVYTGSYLALVLPILLLDVVTCFGIGFLATAIIVPTLILFSIPIYGKKVKKVRAK